MNVLNVLKVLQKGYEVANPEAMKKKQVTANIAGIAAAGVCVALKVAQPELALFDYQDELTAVFTWGMGALNYYFTVASTKKVGPLGN